MNTVTVNGTTVNVPPGSSISVVNGQIIVNGIGTLKAEPGNNYTIVGNPDYVRVDNGSVNVQGAVGRDVVASGSVTCQDVGRDINAGGSITCRDVTGGIDVGGSAKCGNVGGRVQAGGSVRYGG